MTARSARSARSWVEVVRGRVPDAKTIGQPSGWSGDAVVIGNGQGYVTVFFGLHGERGWSLGWGGSRVDNTGERGRYTGRGWQERLIDDAWKALAEVWEDEPPRTA